MSCLVVRFHDADRTITSGRYDVETPHLSCIVRCKVVDEVALNAVFMQYRGGSNSLLYAYNDIILYLTMSLYKNA